MNISAILIGLFAGLILGLLFFAGLWLTIRKGLSARHSGLWFSLSLVVRMGVVALGLFWLSSQNWQSLVAGLAGFIVLRQLLTGKIKRQIENIRQSSKGVSNEN